MRRVDQSIMHALCMYMMYMPYNLMYVWAECSYVYVCMWGASLTRMRTSCLGACIIAMHSACICVVASIRVRACSVCVCLRGQFGSFDMNCTIGSVIHYCINVQNRQCRSMCKIDNDLCTKVHVLRSVSRLTFTCMLWCDTLMRRVRKKAVLLACFVL